MTRMIFGGAVAALVVTAPALAQQPRSDTRTSAEARMVLERRIPSVDGDSVVVKVLEVTYPPGGSSAPHTHPCAVIAYVLEGAIRSRVEGQAETVYGPGESFHEAPGQLHRTSANASDRASARFLACFVCDRETPLTVHPESH
jgi:quercetin dioxygenase-like cupin family protein